MKYSEIVLSDGRLAWLYYHDESATYAYQVNSKGGFEFSAGGFKTVNAMLNNLYKRAQS